MSVLIDFNYAHMAQQMIEPILQSMLLNWGDFNTVIDIHNNMGLLMGDGYSGTSTRNKEAYTDDCVPITIKCSECRAPSERFGMYYLNHQPESSLIIDASRWIALV